MNYLRITSISACILLLYLPIISEAQWVTVGNEIHMTDIDQHVLIGTTDNSPIAKMRIVSSLNISSLLRAEADHNVLSNSEILRLVMPTTSSSLAQFIDAKRDGTTVFEVRRDGDVDIGGDLTLTGELTAMSDLRFKKNVVTIDNALETIMQLRPVSYNFRSDHFPNLKFPSRRKHGLIAQEMEEVLPSFVSIGKSVTNIDNESFEAKSVNYMEMIPLLVKAIQEQQVVIEELTEKLENMN